MDNSTLLKGKTTRTGLYKCYECRKPFTVKIGTIFEDSNSAAHLASGHVPDRFEQEGHQRQPIAPRPWRPLKTAWFMSHRIREAMRSDDMAPLGGEGGVVEVDETFIGKLKGVPKKRAFHHKMKVLALVDRDTGQARTMVIDDVNAQPSCRWSCRTSPAKPA